MRGVKRLHVSASGVAGRSRLVSVSLMALIAAVLCLAPRAFADAPRDDGAQAPTVVRELVGDRTERSATFELSDGTLETKLSTVPMHFRDAAGDWARIDPALESSGADRLTNAAAGFELSIPRTLGSDEEVKVTDGADVVGFSPRVSDSTAAGSVDEGRRGRGFAGRALRACARQLRRLEADAHGRRWVVVCVRSRVSGRCRSDVQPV